MTKKLNVLYQSDNNYAVYMGVSICSLLENNRSMEEIAVYIIDDGISEEHRRQIQDMIASYGRDSIWIEGRQILDSPEFGKFPAFRGMRKNTHSFLKMFLDIVLPKELERIIYIDCDTAVCGSLEYLMNVDMGEKPLGMVLEALVTKTKESVGLRQEDLYFNSGVIVFNLRQWRAENCSKRVLEHAVHKRVYGTVDQAILNVEFKDNILLLPIAYNLQPVHLVYSYKTYCKNYRHKAPYYPEEEICRAVRQPVIIHYLRYVGESPWNKNNVHPAEPYFDKYLALSPWKDYEKKPADRGLVFKIEKALYRRLPRPLFLKLFIYFHDRKIWKSNRMEEKSGE